MTKTRGQIFVVVNVHHTTKLFMLVTIVILIIIASSMRTTFDFLSTIVNNVFFNAFYYFLFASVSVLTNVFMIKNYLLKIELKVKQIEHIIKNMN